MVEMVSLPSHKQISRSHSSHKCWRSLLGLVEGLGKFAAASTANEKAESVVETMSHISDYCTAMEWDLTVIWHESTFLPVVRPFVENTDAIVLVNLGKLCHAHMKQMHGDIKNEDRLIGQASLAKLLAIIRDMSEAAWNEEHKLVTM